MIIQKIYLLKKLKSRSWKTSCCVKTHASANLARVGLVRFRWWVYVLSKSAFDELGNALGLCGAFRMGFLFKRSQKRSSWSPLSFSFFSVRGGADQMRDCSFSIGNIPKPFWLICQPPYHSMDRLFIQATSPRSPLRKKLMTAILAQVLESSDPKK